MKRCFLLRICVIFRVKSIAMNLGRFYTILSAYNYTPQSVYIEGMKFLCTSYAEGPVFDAFSVEKLRERFSNLSQSQHNLSVSFRNLSVSVETDTQICTLRRVYVVEKRLFLFLKGVSQNVKIILHKEVFTPS